MGSFKDSVSRWANGSPPITDEIYKYIYKHFSLLFVLSSWFPDFRPKYRLFSVLFGIVYAACTGGYVWLYVITVYKQKDDLPAASLSAIILIIHFLTLSVTVLINCKRDCMIYLFRSMFEDFFSYKDDEVIPEMREEITKATKQKIFVMIFQPVYIFMTAVAGITRRPIDAYTGLIETPYVEEIYMLTPVPCWYPFRVTNDFIHYATSLSQVITASMNASFFIALTGAHVIFMQSIGLQIRILIYRIRSLEAYSSKILMREKDQTTREPKTQAELYEDPEFLRIFNKNLNICAQHHINIITNYTKLRDLYAWPLLVGQLTLSLMVCVSLLLIVVAGKPSDLAFGGTLFFDEVLNMGLMCWQTEQVSMLSASIHEELYALSWKDLDARAKRTIMIMIERSKQPLVLTASVTHMNLNWETYCRILNTAYSYVNLLSAAVPQSTQNHFSLENLE